MKIETEIRDDHQARLTVELDESSMEDAKQRAARKLARQVKIPGFRPGKAPYAMILRQIGEGAILEEATEILVNDIYPQAIEEAGIEPYGPGSLENVESVEPPKFEFLVPLRAEVELGDYRSVSISYEYEPVTEDAVEQAVQELRERQAVLEPADRPVQEGDMVYIRLSGKRTQAPEGEDPTLVRERPMPVIVEEESADTTTEWPFPGFSRQVIGMSAGDEKTLTHTFSQESQFESLRGVEAEFQVKVEEVKARLLPELNDDFAQAAGEFSTLEELYQRVRDDLDAQARNQYHEEYDEKVLEEMVNISTIKYAPQMLEQEIDSTIEQLNSRLAQQNQDIDLYLKAREMDMDALREEVRPTAETQLKRKLVLMEIAEAEKIVLDPDEVQSETIRTMEMMQRVLSKAEARRLSDQSTVQNLIQNIMMDMMTGKTFELIRQIARGDAPPLPGAEAAETPTGSGEAAPEAAAPEAGAVEAEAPETAAPAQETEETAGVEASSEPVEESASGDEGSVEENAGAAGQENQ